LNAITIKSDIKKANRAIEENFGNCADDPYRPVYHPIAPHGWMNDPNGLIYIDGWYHVFYQWNPYGSEWGNMHWGHMRSRNLHEWEHLPTALVPEKNYEPDGCFSGSAVWHQEKLHLFYTGNQFKPEKHPHYDGRIAVQYQCVATSENNVYFTKNEENPIIDQAPENGTLCDFRDPKVWRENDHWMMILGSRNDSKGELVIYKSSDLISWEYDSRIVGADETLGYMWECPDWVKLSGKTVTLFSLLGAEKYDRKNVSGYIVGNMHEVPSEAFELIDYGPHFYAPQTFYGLEEKPLLIGWVPMPQLNPESHTWSGCLTLPRSLSLSDSGKVQSRPTGGFEKFRECQNAHANVEIKPQTPIRMNGDVVELALRFKSKNVRDLCIKLKASNDLSEYTAVKIDCSKNQILLDWSKSGVDSSQPFECTSAVYNFSESDVKDSFDIRLFIDKSVVEIYAMDGQCVMSASIPSDPGHKMIEISSATQNSCIDEIKLYEIHPSVHTLNLEETI